MKIMTILLLAAVLLVGCGADVPETDLEGLKAMRSHWQAAYDARDAGAIAALYAADGTVYPPNADKAMSRPVIEAFWDEFLSSGLGARISDTEVSASGDVGYKVGTYMLTDPAGAPLDVGKYVEIWRYIDGRWQLLHDIYNSDMPVPEPVAPALLLNDEAEVFEEEDEIIDEDMSPNDSQ